MPIYRHEASSSLRFDCAVVLLSKANGYSRATDVLAASEFASGMSEGLHQHQQDLQLSGDGSEAEASTKREII